MPKGIVQFFLKTKAYGFIRIAETGEEFYVHQKEILESIQKGDVVEFEVGENQQGLFAKEVRVVIFEEPKEH